MGQSHHLGRLGEAIALNFLEISGYTCLAQQYRKPGGEIDLIVRRDNEIVFVEVKARGPHSLAPPEAWVDARKLARMRLTARHWLVEHCPPGSFNFRFDVVAVEFEGENKGLLVRHLAGVV